MNKMRVKDQDEMLGRLRHDLIVRLRNLPGQKSSDNEGAAFNRLLLGIDAARVGSAFLDLIEEYASDRCSFYEALEKYPGGISCLAEELIRMSEVPETFGGRATQRFGIVPMQFRLVRLPEPVGRRDREIREALVDSFQKLDVTEIVSGDHRRAVVVLQIFAGYPLGIDEGVRAMAASYRESVMTGHLPHLVSVIPDAQAEHSPSLLSLLESSPSSKPPLTDHPVDL